MKTFTASLESFRKMSVDAMETILKASTQDVIGIMLTPKARGGRMPVLDGYLINSLASSENGTFAVSKGTPDKTGADSEASVLMAINNMALGKTTYFAFTAGHSAIQELGGEIIQGNHYAGSAAAQWEALVEKNAKEVSR